MKICVCVFVRVRVCVRVYKCVCVRLWGEMLYIRV